MDDTSNRTPRHDAQLDARHDARLDGLGRGPGDSTPNAATDDGPDTAPNDGPNDGPDATPDDDLDTHAFTAAIENFNRFYIRLPVLEQRSFTTLSVLDTLAFSDKPMRLSELTKTEQVSQPGLTQLVTRLEREGLVERRPDPRDGRAVLVHITEAGRRIGRSRHADRTRHLVPLLAQLTTEERQALANALPALSRLAELGRGQGQGQRQRQGQG
ncbi:MarR family transcriptional regulator [Streptomyces sp. NPDC003077]|uniref:MarR family winged helix-turn-helix transcriptional regulator n=1 Tax=Streptomyces sp. NPDC003077 TaxID=3154443 RepID=UPI0033B34175